MTLNRKKLYILLITALVAGYIWLAWGLIDSKASKPISVDVCLLKHVTNMPCPSCGSTRSVVSLVQGHPIEAFMINPLGIVIFIFMTVIPLWLLFDVISKKQTLLNAYNTVELHIKKPGIALPLIVLVLMNWLWNIAKGL